ncbi:MAG: aspartate-semialdehyde dehydrogenase, partial [Firmicutes bacterium]|nr:aspartate-semialdehyde dehydrogenase [Bacillota bacterium]
MGYKIAVLGATGAVGREMINVLEEYQIPVDELKLLASARSAGQTIPFAGKDIAVEEAKEDSFEGMDFVLGAVQNPMAVKFAPHIVKSGAVFIDNSSAFRQDPDVPLVVPEINGQDAFTHKGIIANPNCSTIITMVAIGALAKLSPVRTMVASTY